MLPTLAVLAASAAAAYTDIRSGRIPNALCIAVSAAGVISAARVGPQAMLSFAGILAALLLVGALVHAAGLAGGGDLKFLAAACATLGIHDGTIFLFATLFAGGVLAVGTAARHGRLRETVASVQAIALPLFAGVRPVMVASGVKMPYAIAFLCGALVLTIVHLI